MNTLMLWVLYMTTLGLTATLYVPVVWSSAFRRWIAGAIVIASGVMVGSALCSSPASLYVPLGLLHIYVLFNLFRIVEQRMNGHYMYRATAQTFIGIYTIQALYGGLWFVFSKIPGYAALMSLLLLQAVFVLFVYLMVRRRLAASILQTYTDGHVATPTVTIAIPARDETDDLQACLESLLASHYSKLEILVLDDCSQSRQTSEIIKDFAHKGVRFIQGEPVKDYWLAKNQAYAALAEAASGEIVLFCGVDTRFAPDTIQQLVNQMAHSKKRMISLMPVRAHDSTSKWAPVQFNRYFRELAFPSFVLRRPPVLSTCFLIYRADITTLGGFAAARRTINPEGYFARQLAVRQQYAFLRGTEALGLSSVKSPAGQRRTAIRTFYPQLHKRPESVLLLTLVIFVMVYGPLIIMFLAAFGVIPVAYGAVGLSIKLLWLMAYVSVVRATGVNKSIRALLYSPLVSLYDVVLLHVSMWRYEFSEVVWKGRNICEPVMHVLPHLPSLDEERRS